MTEAIKYIAKHVPAHKLLAALTIPSPVLGRDVPLSGAYRRARPTADPLHNPPTNVIRFDPRVVRL